MPCAVQPTALSPPSKRARLRERLPQSAELRGLPNLGNTCYMNSVLQCLLNLPGDPLSFCRELEDEKDSMCQRVAELATEYRATGNARTVASETMTRFKKAAERKNTMWLGWRQQDAYEFLNWILDTIDEEFTAFVKKSGREPVPGGVVPSIFGITTYTERRCHRCDTSFTVDVTVGLALMLPLVPRDLSVKAGKSLPDMGLTEALNMAQVPEVLEGYECDECTKGDPKIRCAATQVATLIKKTSNMLIISPLRFLPDWSGTFTASKVKRCLRIPMLIEDDGDAYLLCGVVSHIGETLEFGHYIAAVRSQRDYCWYKCNDGNVTFLEEGSRDVLPGNDGCDREVENIGDNDEPVLLFYSRCGATAAE